MKIKYIICILVVLWSIQVKPQGAVKTPVGVLANDYTTVSFFFPSNISKVIAPAANYKFEYDEGSNLGLLKARKGNPSNLTVITEQGNIFSFLLQFSDKVDNFNFFLSVEDAVGQTNSPKQTEPKNDSRSIDDIAYPTPTPVSAPIDSEHTDLMNTTDEHQSNASDAFLNDAPSDAPTIEEGDLYNMDREEYYRIFCENNYLQRTIFKRSFRQNKRIVVKLNNILVDRNEMYLVMQLENSSKKEYPISGLGFFLKKDVNEPEQMLEPLYTFNLQDMIDPESINEIVCVFPRIILGSKEEFFVVLDEKDGNRTVLLPLDSKQINAPTN